MGEIHAHIETYSTDCDGPISRTYVMTMNDSERNSDFGDIEFHDRVTAHIVNTFSLMSTGRLDVNKYDSNHVSLRWFEPTEEGSNDKRAVFCADDCDTGENSYCDHRAESAGY